MDSSFAITEAYAQGVTIWDLANFRLNDGSNLKHSLRACIKAHVSLPQGTSIIDLENADDLEGAPRASLAKSRLGNNVPRDTVELVPDLGYPNSSAAFDKGQDLSFKRQRQQTRSMLEIFPRMGAKSDLPKKGHYEAETDNSEASFNTTKATSANDIVSSHKSADGEEKENSTHFSPLPKPSSSNTSDPKPATSESSNAKPTLPELQEKDVQHIQDRMMGPLKSRTVEERPGDSKISADLETMQPIKESSPANTEKTSKAEKPSKRIPLSPKSYTKKPQIARDDDPSPVLNTIQLDELDSNCSYSLDISSQ